MVKEVVRKCSHCGHCGHNSRTCNGKSCFKLFGVNILEKQEQPLKKSASMGNIESSGENTAVAAHHVDAGYSSDGYMGSNRGRTVHERKKGLSDLSLFYCVSLFICLFIYLCVCFLWFLIQKYDKMGLCLFTFLFDFIFFYFVNYLCFISLSCIISMNDRPLLFFKKFLNDFILA